MLHKEKIAKVVTVALAGGSLPMWCGDAKPVKITKGMPVPMDEKEQEAFPGVVPAAHPDFWDDTRGYMLYDPYAEKWSLLTAAKINRAVDTFSPTKPASYPGEYDAEWFNRLKDRIEEDEFDGGDADTLIQIALFGEVVYG